MILLISCPMLSIGQRTSKQIYLGGINKLNNELSDFLAGKENIQDDTAHIFFIQILANKKATIEDDKIQFKVFGKDTVIKNLLIDFFISRKKNWNYNELKKMNGIVPIFISSYRINYNNIFIDWNNFLTEEFPESQEAIFVKPLIVQLYCCPSTPSKDF